MRPPICAICNERFPTSEGGLISFQLSDSDKISNKAFKQKGFTGHPKGLEWFCGEHITKAKTLSHLTYKEAMIQMSES